MGMAALAEPLAIKISSKRQITIRESVRGGGGSKNYALCTWSDKRHVFGSRSTSKTKM